MLENGCGKWIKCLLHQYGRENVKNIYKQTRVYYAEYINIKNIENMP